MKALRNSVLLAIILVLLAGMLHSGVSAQTATRITTSVVVEQTQYGVVDWTNGIVRVQGSAVAPSEGGIAQRKLMARRGAIVDAQRQLQELIHGLYVEGETLMRDYIVVNDDVKSATQGFISGVAPVPGTETYVTESDGSMSCTVTVEMYLHGLFEAIYRSRQAEFGTATVAVTTVSPHTGLIIDVKGIPGYRKAPIFRVVTVSGQVLYGVNYAGYQYACASGLASYINSVIAAKQQLAERVGGSPYVVTAVSVRGGDIIVSDDVARVVLGMRPVLQECKVVIVSN